MTVGFMTFSSVFRSPDQLLLAPLSGELGETGGGDAGLSGLGAGAGDGAGAGLSAVPARVAARAGRAGLSAVSARWRAGAGRAGLSARCLAGRLGLSARVRDFGAAALPAAAFAGLTTD
jgi:hypothetical protein